MKTRSLFDALHLVCQGHASETLDHLYHMRTQGPSDLATHYVLAHALDACGQHNQATSVWKTANDLQAASEPLKDTQSLGQAPPFTYTDRLQIEISRILQGDDADEIQQLILKLDAAERVSFDGGSEIHEEDLQEEDALETYDDPVTETFARILIAQKEYLKAAEVYRSLSVQYPSEKDRMLKQVSRLEDMARSQPDS